jgi:hypothetical protein
MEAMNAMLRIFEVVMGALQAIAVISIAIRWKNDK